MWKKNGTEKWMKKTTMYTFQIPKKRDQGLERPRVKSEINVFYAQETGRCDCRRGHGMEVK